MTTSSDALFDLPDGPAPRADRPLNLGHGHVWPRPDGARARCGGPGICRECSRDAALRDGGTGAARAHLRAAREMLGDGGPPVARAAVRAEVDAALAALGDGPGAGGAAPGSRRGPAPGPG